MVCRFSHPFSPFSTGTSLVEYLLPTALVGLVILAGTVAFVSGGFKTQGALKAFQGEGYAGTGKGLLGTRAMGKNPYLQPYRFQLPNGNSILLADFPVSMAAEVEVAGGHGTSENTMALMDRLIQQLVAAGEITPEEAPLFKALSNSGHDISHLIGKIEAPVAGCGDSKACLTAAYVGEGNSAMKRLKVSSRQTVLETHSDAALVQDKFHVLSADETLMLKRLLPRLAETADKELVYNYNADNMVLGDTAYRFLQNYMKVNGADSTLSPPAQAMLQYLGSSILSLGIRTVNAAGNAAQYRSYLENYDGVALEDGSLAQTSPKDFAPFLTEAMRRDDLEPRSTLAHAHAARICDMGSGEDTGTTCR